MLRYEFNECNVLKYELGKCKCKVLQYEFGKCKVLKDEFGYMLLLVQAIYDTHTSVPLPRPVMLPEPNRPCSALLLPALLLECFQSVLEIIQRLLLGRG